MLTKNRTCSLALSAALLAALGTTNASAALLVTNGTFTQPGGYNADVFDWYDGNADGGIDGNQYQDTFIDTNPQPPAAGTEVVFSGNASPPPQNFLYQSIGTKGATNSTLNFKINIGDFTVSTSYRDGTLETGLFQSGTFTGADGTDVLGAAGVTQIDLTVIKFIQRGGTFPNQADETGSFSLASANIFDPIYLRFHWTPSIPTANYYLGADNVTITVDDAPPVPEPSTLVLFGLGSIGLVGYALRRNHRRA